MAGTRADSDKVPPPALVEALEEVWTEMAAAAPGALPPQRLRGLLRAVSVAARNGNAQPEELIIWIKGSWSRHAQVRPSDQVEARKRLSDVVSVCISEFFSEDGKS
jgi:hypothetical protein